MNAIPKKSLTESDFIPQKVISKFNPSQYLIMLVGQDAETLLLLKTLLELWKYKTVEAGNAEEAKNISCFFKPQLIIMDTSSSCCLTMENLYKIRRSRDLKMLPLFVISGYANPEFRETALTNGADDFFVKPLNFSRMEKSLKKFITGKKDSEDIEI